MVENLIGLALFAILVEAVTNVIEELREGGKFNTNLLIALIISLVAAVGFNIDIFKMVGFNTVVPYLGAVLTGVIISRGSNYVNDIINRLRKGTKDEEEVEIILVEVEEE